MSLTQERVLKYKRDVKMVNILTFAFIVGGSISLYFFLRTLFLVATLIR